MSVEHKNDNEENNGNEIQERIHEDFNESINIVQRSLCKIKDINLPQSEESSPNKLALPPKSTNILVVDDDQINLMVASTFLKQLKEFNFELAHDGIEAIKVLTKRAQENFYFDLILMDCNMPRMDGFEATKIINEMVENRKLPRLSIIACTANASPLDYEMCFKSGMSDYISKPYSKADLSAKIQKVISKKKEISFSQLK